MKRLLTHLALLLTLNVNATSLSPYSKVSVLTCNPGTDPYAIFGHSAIRVSDSVTGVDIVFNYGTFNFDDPHFYRKFLGGRLLYFLDTASFNDFLPEYQDGSRIIWEQVLKLTTAEKQAIFDRLLDNLKEEHRYYRYDFLYDNCSTRIRDDIEFIRGSSWITPPPAGIRSFRQQFAATYAYNPWAGFGIDICTGLPADKHPDAKQNLFLPQDLFDALERAHIVDSTIVYDFSKGTNPSAFTWTAPLPVAWFLFAISLLILAAEIKLRRRFKLFDITLLTVTGLVGLAMLSLWAFTDHRIAYWNLNLLWACPLNIVAAISLRFKKRYFPFYSIVLGLLIIFLLIEPRFLNAAVLPLILTLLTRTVRRI